MAIQDWKIGVAGRGWQGLQLERAEFVRLFFFFFSPQSFSSVCASWRVHLRVCTARAALWLKDAKSRLSDAVQEGGQLPSVRPRGRGDWAGLDVPELNLPESLSNIFGLLLVSFWFPFDVSF